MKKNNKIIFYMSIVLYLNSCSGLSDVGKVLRNEKVRTTDEFLVKKREPLTMPPDHNSIPTPGSIRETQDKKKGDISEILNMSQETKNKKNNSSSLEDSIINKIGK